MLLALALHDDRPVDQRVLIAFLVGENRSSDVTAWIGTGVFIALTEPGHYSNQQQYGEYRNNTQNQIIRFGSHWRKLLGLVGVSGQNCLL